MATSDSTTHAVYRIVNFRTGKVYVGQTNNPKIRWGGHLSKLKRHQHDNPYLQAAFNKYGRDAFYFEVLERDIKPEDINTREVYWIEYFNSFKNGFNLTAGGHNPHTSQFVSCSWNGISYASIAECARANNVDHTLMIWRFNKGYTCDADMRGQGSKKSIPVTFDGIDYPSINAAARACGVGHTAMWERLNKGYRGSDDIPNVTLPQTCVWEGVEYKSITDCATANGVRVSTMQYRIAQGYKSKSDMKHRTKK